MKTSYILMAVTIISKIFGLAREKALAYFFGTSLIAESILVALQIPMTFTNVISGATANGYIPIYNEIDTSKNKEDAEKFTSNLSNIVFVFMFFVSILGVIFTPHLVRAMASGFSGESFEMAVYMTRVCMISLSVTSVFSIFKAYLQIKKNFIASIIHSVIMNIIIISTFWIGKNKGIYFISIGLLIGFIFQYVVFFPYIRKNGYKHKFVFNLRDEDFLKLTRIILPVIISTSVIEINFIISKSLASSIFPGALASLNFAYKLQSFITGIVVTSIVTATYPSMSLYGSKKDMIGLKNSLSEAIVTMSILVIPSSIGLFIFALPIVRLLFEGGAFTIDDSKVTALVLSFYTFGIIAIGFREIILRGFYSIMNTKLPVINSLVVVTINISLSFILVKSMGIAGLGLATSLSFVAGALILVFSLSKKIGRIFNRNSLKEIIKIVICSLLMGIVAKVSFEFLNKMVDNNLSLLLSISMAGVIYLASLILFKVSEFTNMISKLKNRNR